MPYEILEDTPKGRYELLPGRYELLPDRPSDAGNGYDKAFAAATQSIRPRPVDDHSYDAIMQRLRETLSAKPATQPDSLRKPWEEYAAKDSARGPWEDYQPAETTPSQNASAKPKGIKNMLLGVPIMPSGLTLRDAGNLAAGAVRGAGSIGATIIAPLDMARDAIAGKGLSLESNQQRRKDMTGGLQSLGADTDSLAFDAGKVGGEIAGTAGLGGLLANGARAVGAAPTIANALVAGGMKIGAPAAKALSVPGAKNMLTRITGGALTGGAMAGMINPEDAWKGAAAGAVLPAVVGGVSRVISPNASINANVALLKNEGVTPTIGQALGGRWNALEEKLMSVPIMGDMIGTARARSLEQFNNAAINRASGKVGANVQGFGQSAVRDAGDILSRSYDDAIAQVKYLKFDPQFSSELAQLKGMTQQLTPPMRSKFNSKLDDVVGGRMSGNGSMLGDVYKRVDSEIGSLAARYQKSAVASEAELGDAFAQLQNLMKQQAMRSNPKAAEALKAADAGWANLVRIEQAAKAGKNAEGIFTPAQLNAAIQQADQSVRGRAVARGTALMQDLGNAGQQVLGNKVPNSFTTDRVLLGGGAIGSGLLNPAIPLGLLGAGAMYTRPMQGLLASMVTARPQLAKPVADALRKASPTLTPGGVQMGLGLLNSPGQR